MTFSFEGFTRYIKKPNTIKFGSLYTKKIEIPFSKEKKRILRVWLPEDYDGKKRFPVFYFCDGQNLVDRYSSAYGDWQFDKRIHEFINLGHTGIILVGIDCPIDPDVRIAEYLPLLDDKRLITNKIPYLHDKRRPQKLSCEPYAELYADYIVNEIRSLIDETFLTKRDPGSRGFGGSSMGGIFSFYIVNQYPNIFKMCLSFSPAFMFHKPKYAKKYIKRISKNDTKIAFYCGGQGKLEERILKSCLLWYKFLDKYKFNKENLNLIINHKYEHNEAAWTKFVIPSLLFLFNKK